MQVARQTQISEGYEPVLPQMLAGESLPSSPQELPVSSVTEEGANTLKNEARQAEGPLSQSAGKTPRCAEHARVWTPARREAVESYVAYLQEVLRLRDWTITVDWSKPTGKDAFATMTQMADSKHATLRLSPEFVTTESRLHGQILIHEMVHCHLFQMESLVSAMASAVAGKDATAMFNRAYTSANELTTDALADVLEPLVAPFRLP